MKQYKVSVLGKIFFSVCSVIIMALGVLLFIYGSEHCFSRLSCLYFAVTIILLLISVLCLLYTFRSYVSLSDTDVIIYDGVSRKETIPFSKILFYTVTNRSLFITHTKLRKDGTEKTKVTSVYLLIKDWQEIIQCISQHNVSSVEEKVAEKEAVELANGEHGKLSKQEQDEKLKQATIITKICTVVSVAAGVWYLFFPAPYPVSTGVNLVLSIISILMLKISDGWIHFDKKKGSKYPTILPSFMISSVALCLGAIKRYELYAFKSGLFLILAFWAGITGFFFLCQSEIKFNGKNKWVSIFCAVFLFSFFAIGAGITVNCEYDYSKPNISFATVADKRISSGKSTTYYLTVTPWIDGKTEEKEVSVSKQEYNKAENGQKIAIGLQKGLFNVPWYWTDLLDENEDE